MKRFFSVSCLAVLLACNVSVNDEERRDSARGNDLDTFLHRADTTLDRWGDSIKAGYKDVRDDVRDRFRDDDSARRLR